MAATWTERFPASAPIPRELAALATDPVRARTLLFGGETSLGTLLGDTWELTTSAAWIQQAPPSSPSPRSRHGASYDAASGRRIVIYGGVAAGPTYPTDTWIWDGSAYTEVFPVDNPGPRVGHRMVFDPATGMVFLFGGRSSVGGTLLDDTWVYDDTNWTQLFPATTPPARDEHLLVADEVAGNVVMFSGSNGAADTWLWAGVNWALQTPVHSPAARQGAIGGYSAEIPAVSMFGGQIAGDPDFTNQTWLWSAGDWAQIVPPSSPAARYDAAGAADPSGFGLVMFGGLDDADAALGDTWTFLSGSPPGQEIDLIGRFRIA